MHLLTLDLSSVFVQQRGILHSQMQCESLLEHTEMHDIMSKETELCQSYQYIPWHSNVSGALHSGINLSGYCTETRLAFI